MGTMYQDVLVPPDGSDTVSETLDHAIDLARNHDATIHALYVVDSRIVAAADDGTRSDLEGTLEREGAEAVAAVERRARSEGLDAVTAVRPGTPSRVIREYAEEADVDIVVIGTTGKTPREKVTSLGSVSERVVDSASVPVLVVRNAGAE